MQITFDPHKPEDAAHVVGFLVAAGIIPNPNGDDDDDDTAPIGFNAAPPAAPAAPADPGSLGLDSKGTPHLPEFHTKTKNTNGTWRRQKGVDKDKAALAEMQARGAAPIATHAQAAAPAAPQYAPPAAPQYAPPATAYQPPQFAPPPAGSPAPTAAAPQFAPPAPPAPAGYSHAEFIDEVNRYQLAHPGVITGELWNHWHVVAGIVDTNVLQTSEEARKALIAHVRAHFAQPAA